MSNPRPLPDWPAVLHEAWAAAYLSLSPSTFRSIVVPEVPPVKLTAIRVGWLRADLDKWIARKAGHAVPTKAGDDAGNEWMERLRTKRHVAS